MINAPARLRGGGTAEERPESTQCDCRKSESMLSLPQDTFFCPILSSELLPCNPFADDSRRYLMPIRPVISLKGLGL